MEMLKLTRWTSLCIVSICLSNSAGSRTAYGKALLTPVRSAFISFVSTSPFLTDTVKKEKYILMSLAARLKMIILKETIQGKVNLNVDV